MTGPKAVPQGEGGNVLTLALPSNGEFTPRERAQLRQLLEDFDKVAMDCPIARRIVHPEDSA